jgi:hypothetical protein
MSGRAMTYFNSCSCFCHRFNDTSNQYICNCNCSHRATGGYPVKLNIIFDEIERLKKEIEELKKNSIKEDWGL